MFLPDLPVSVAFGSLIALANRPAVPDPQWPARTYRVTLLYGLLFHCPDSFFAFLWYPDWNLGYYVPWERVSLGGAALLDVLLLGVLMAGAWLGVRFGRERAGGALAVAAVAGVAFGIVMAIVWDRYQHVGTYAQYHSGTAALAVKDPVFQMFTVLAGAYLLVPFLSVLGVSRWCAARLATPIKR